MRAERRPSRWADHGSSSQHLGPDFGSPRMAEVAEKPKVVYSRVPSRVARSGGAQRTCDPKPVSHPQALSTISVLDGDGLSSPTE